MSSTTDKPRKRIVIDAPSEAVILAARHLDATEGAVQVGRTVDSATRSAINTVLRYIAKAHNSPAADATTSPPRRMLTLDCSTCGATGITVWADHVNACPGIGEIQVSRHRGRGVVVDHAPPRALVGLHVIRDLTLPVTVQQVGDPDLINIADQVLYRVVGYDPGTASLIVELVEDWRPNRSDDGTTDGVCTATFKNPEGTVIRCAQPAGHYDGDNQPDPLTEDEPGGWHRSAPDAGRDRVTWADWAGNATPHRGQE